MGARMRGVVNEGDRGAQARDGTCLFRKIGHTQIRNDTFLEQASSVSGLGTPVSFVHSPPLFAPPFVCTLPICAPHPFHTDKGFQR